MLAEQQTAKTDKLFFRIIFVIHSKHAAPSVCVNLCCMRYGLATWGDTKSKSIEPWERERNEEKENENQSNNEIKLFKFGIFSEEAIVPIGLNDVCRGGSKEIKIKLKPKT